MNCGMRIINSLFDYFQEADVAAGPMYVTSQRAKVVDFSIPFLDVHATLLLRKPPPGVKLRIKSVSDLINQSEIKYGTLNRGILVRAFKNTNSTKLRIMWRNMVRFDPTVYTSTNEAGIERVRKEKYAFVIPHTIGEYMSMQEPCDLVTVDRFLMDRGYCLAVNKGSELLQQFNLAIRTLNDNGRLAELYRTWWLGWGQCNSHKPHQIYGSAYIASSLSVGLCTPVYSVIICLIVYVITCIYIINTTATIS
jgi:ABC-type amino acid transport substrate-binding protein